MNSKRKDNIEEPDFWISRDGSRVWINPDSPSDIRWFPAAQRVSRAEFELYEARYTILLCLYERARTLIDEKRREVLERVPRGAMH
jgi:hypothetical protein